MNTIKSAAVIVVLAGVLYGVYVALNKPETPLPSGVTAKQVEEMGPPQVDFGGSGEASSTLTTLPAPPAALFPGEAVSPAQLNPADSASAPQTATASGAADPATAPPGGSAYSLAPPLEKSSAPQVPSNTSENSSLTGYSFRRDWQQAEQLIAGSQFREALALLSPYYLNQELSPEDRQQLVTWLDALAAKVIYSREHLLGDAYPVRSSRETLFDIADQYHVPWQLLMNINSQIVNDPRILLPGTELKIVPGPMRADVNLAASEITVFLNELYAGRFPIAVGSEPPQPGEYTVLDKRPERTYIGADGRMIPANDPANPYGACWIDLGREASIHGSPLTSAGGSQTLGCISLSPQDAKDVYAILSQGSAVTIRR